MPSRRTTPQPQSAVTAASASTAPTATRGPRARSTRSQSTDPPVAVTQPAPAKSNRRGARQVSVESASSAEGRAGSRATRRNARNNPTIGDLTTVHEHPAADEVVEEVALINEERAETPPPDDQPEFKSPGARSNVSMSGTTALSTISDTEAADLDPDLIVKLGPDLYDSASKVLNVLTPPKANVQRFQQIMREIKKPGSTVGKLFDQHEQNFTGYLGHFGRSYLNAQTIMKGLFGAHSLPPRDAKSWRLTEVIQTANLACLASWIASAERDSSETWNTLRNLDQTFPIPFLTSMLESDAVVFVVGHSTLLNETFNFALAIRTQVAVIAMIQRHNQPDFDAERFIQDVFYAVPGDPSENETLRAWDVNGLGSGNTGLLPEFNAKMQERIALIQQCFNEDSQAYEAGEYADMQRLQTQFPWSDFCVQTLQWIHSRKRELDTMIQERGGVHNIMATLKLALRMEDSMIVLSKLEASPTTQRANPRKAVKKKKPPRKSAVNNDEFMQDYYQFVEAHSGADATLAPQAGRPTNGSQVRGLNTRATSAPHSRPQYNRPHIAEQDDGDDWRAIEDDEEMDVAEAGPSRRAHKETNERLAKWENVQRQNKENRQRSQNPSDNSKRPMFIDQQDDAERVVWDDASQAASQSRHAEPQKQARVVRGKRPRPVELEDVEEDVSEDEGFQNDTRSVNVEQRRREAPTGFRRRIHQPTQSPPKRQRVGPSTASSSGSYRPPRAETVPEEDEAEDLRMTTQYLKSSARQIRIGARGTSKQPQVRRPWTQEEELRLVELIGEFGISWSTLKANDNGDYDEEMEIHLGPRILRNRDQVALKDKARNMKVLYLQNGIDLPRHFDLVPLDKKAKTKLEALGIEY